VIALACAASVRVCGPPCTSVHRAPDGTCHLRRAAATRRTPPPAATPPPATHPATRHPPRLRRPTRPWRPRLCARGRRCGRRRARRRGGGSHRPRGIRGGDGSRTRGTRSARSWPRSCWRCCTPRLPARPPAQRTRTCVGPLNCDSPLSPPPLAAACSRCAVGGSCAATAPLRAERRYGAQPARSGPSPSPQAWCSPPRARAAAPPSAGAPPPTPRRATRCCCPPPPRAAPPSPTTRSDGPTVLCGCRVRRAPSPGGGCLHPLKARRRLHPIFAESRALLKSFYVRTPRA